MSRLEEPTPDRSLESADRLGRQGQTGARLAPYQAPLLLSLSLSEKRADSCLAVLLRAAFFLPRGRSWVHQYSWSASLVEVARDRVQHPRQTCKSVYSPGRASWVPPRGRWPVPPGTTRWATSCKEATTVDVTRRLEDVVA